MQGRFLLLCFVGLILASAAAPGDATAAYLAARDRYIADFNTHPTANASDRRMDRALADLEGQLKAIVPPWHSSGFSSEGKISLGSLEHDIDFGALDGLSYRKGGIEAVVSTPVLVRRWIVDHNRWWGSSDNIPQPFETAIHSEEFWTYAMFDDSRALLLGELPVTLRDGTAVALLAAFAQEEIRDAGPGSLLAAAVRGDRVVLARQNLKPDTVALAVCQAPMRDALAKSDAAYKAYQASRLSDKALFDESVQMEEKADRDYRACFAMHLREQPRYGAIVRQAQVLVDALD